MSPCRTQGPSTSCRRSTCVGDAWSGSPRATSTGRRHTTRIRSRPRVEFATAGAAWLHVVDLDAARTGVPAHRAIIAAIAAAVGEGVRVEVAGGLRDARAVAEVLEGGAARAVIGTAALASPSFAGELVTVHGAARIAVAIDVRDGRAVGHGWSDDGPRCGRRRRHPPPGRSGRPDLRGDRDRPRRPSRRPGPRALRTTRGARLAARSSPRAASRAWPTSWPFATRAVAARSSVEPCTKAACRSVTRSRRLPDDRATGPPSGPPPLWPPAASGQFHKANAGVEPAPVLAPSFLPGSPGGRVVADPGGHRTRLDEAPANTLRV